MALRALSRLRAWWSQGTQFLLQTLEQSTVKGGPEQGAGKYGNLGKKHLNSSLFWSKCPFPQTPWSIMYFTFTLLDTPHSLTKYA